MKNLGGVPKEDREHFMKCKDCGHYIDKRDLGQVFFHTTGHPEPGKEIKAEWSSSRKLGKPEEYLNDKKKTKLDLN